MNKYRLAYSALALIALSLIVSLCGCFRSGSDSGSYDPDSLSSRMPDTLKVVTLYSPTSFFIYREERMGYDYDLVSRFAADKGMALDLEVAPSLNRALEMLDSGMVDLIAYEVPVTGENKQRVIPCGVENITNQVLVQPKSRDGSRITDVTQLIGHTVYVERDSKYHHRLNNLNNELGGGIEIKPIDRDTLITEDLIDMVSKGEIPLTVVDSDIARLNKTYFNDLDITVEISFPQRSAWAVSPDKPWLADSIDSWTVEEKPRMARARLLKRYFERSKNDVSRGVYHLDLSSGRVSPFDDVFKSYAEEIGWDWRLIAAQGYAESHFDSTQVSWAGARGIMQIMPGTARAFGLSADEIAHNDKNISTAIKIISNLDKSLSQYVSDKNERMKFVVAAYNSGIAHIYDAIALANKHGLDSGRWENGASQALMMKMNPEYYNDPVCKYGYFRGRQTCEYVKSVFEIYNQIKDRIPK